MSYVFLGFVKMKRLTSEQLGVKMFRLFRFLLCIAALYLLYMCYKFTDFFESVGMLSGNDSYDL